MTEITTRNTTRGKEYIFRYNGKLYACKTKQEAQVKLQQLANGDLFECI